MKKIYTVILIIIFNSCSLINKNEPINIGATHCQDNSSCLKNEICDANYCVSSKIEDSKVSFSLKFIPNNKVDNNKYYHIYQTEILNSSNLINKNSFEVSVSDYVEFSGEIKNNKQLSLNYKLNIYDKNNNSTVSYSYKDGKNTYFHFKIPKGTYKLNVIPDKYYPPFTMNLNEINTDDKNHLIVIDREISLQNYTNILGTMKVKIDGSLYFPNSYKIYAFTQKNNIETIISNQFTCNKKCENFKLTIQDTNEQIFLKIKIELLKNIEFKIPIKSINTLDDIEVDLGEFHTSNLNNIILTGDCNEDFKNINIKVIGNLNKYAVYKNNFYYNCSSQKCENKFNLYQGNFNLYINPNSISCYMSKFLNIDIKNNSTNINIKLNKKKRISGTLISNDASPIEGTVSFTRKDNSLSTFKVLTHSNINGSFNILLEPGEYDVLIQPENSFINYSNWIYLNQRITVNTDSVLYIVPRSFKIPLHLYAQGNKPLQQAQVTMYLHNLKDLFPNENGYLYPESYPLYESITDSEGKFILSVPIIE